MSAKSSKACIKLVNAASTPQPLSIVLNGFSGGSHTARVATLEANTTWATNSIDNPNRVVPVKSEVTVRAGRMQHELPGYSIQVMEIDLK
jgi:alpha-L-arabinofuranosidase